MPSLKRKTYFVTAKKFNFLIIVFLLVLSRGYAQLDTLYLDESDRLITKTIFQHKTGSPLYHGLRFDTDTLVLNKVRFNYYFGKLTPSVKTQFFKLLNKRHQIDTTKTLIIHYQDTLKTQDQFPEKDSIVYLDSLSERHIHLWGYDSFLNANKKCIKNHNKYKKTSELLHFYGHNLGHPNNVKKLVWYKDYGLIIKKLFADSYRNFKIIIIHSDGEFFVESRLNEIPNNHLIRRKKWDDYKADFVRRCKALNNY